MELLKHHLARILAVFLYLTVMAGTWDAWWHGAIGRDTFWEPPHILLYSTVLLAIAFGIYGWITTKERVWRRLAIVLLLVPISAPFDELWHRTFGTEDISSPIIVWSPPHIILILAIIASTYFLLPILKQEKNETAKRLFGTLPFASILSLALFLMTPILPTGPWELLGFWGSAIIAAIIVGVYLLADKWLPGIGKCTHFCVFFLLISAISFGEQISPDVIISPHNHPPSWLTIVAFLLPAIFLDVTTSKSPLLRGGGVALLWSGTLYGFSSLFFMPEFRYTSQEMLIGISMSLIGGLVVGFLFSQQAKQTDNNHIISK